MDPTGGIAAATTAAPSRLSFYVAVQIASVLLPGVVLLTELTILGVWLTSDQPAGIRSILDAISTVRAAGTVVFAALGLAASYVIGYLARELGFWLVSLAERVRRRADPSSSRPADWVRLCALFGDDFADKLADLHPVLRHIDPDAESQDSPNQFSFPVGGGHRADTEQQVFEYSKLWLRRHSPTLGIDSIEAEINILVSTLLPVLVLGIDAAVLSGSPLTLRVLAVPVAVLIALAGVRAVLRLRQTERWQAISHVAFDLAMRNAITRCPSPSPDPNET